MLPPARPSAYHRECACRVTDAHVRAGCGSLSPNGKDGPGCIGRPKHLLTFHVATLSFPLSFLPSFRLFVCPSVSLALGMHSASRLPACLMPAWPAPRVFGSKCILDLETNYRSPCRASAVEILTFCHLSLRLIERTCGVGPAHSTTLAFNL